MTRPVTMLALATATPPHRLHQSTALEISRAVLGDGLADFERMTAVFESAGIDTRYLACPVDWYRTTHDFTEKNAAYLAAADALFVTVAERALAEAGIGARDIDTIVTVSTTGIATPSLEARAMRRMDFRPDVARVPVFGLGCAGGVTGLGLAAKLARATPGSVVLFVTIELCSLTLRTERIGKADIISTALFGDGAAACILKVGDEGFAEIAGSAEKTWVDTLDIMGWEMETGGFGVVLNRAIPAFALRNFRAAMDEMLGPQNIRVEAVDRFVCHPGGAKVVDALERALSLQQGALDHERATLRDYGNMSAPTALFVLDRVRKAALPPLSVLTALGPGFTASTVTLRHAA
jgi:alkylresorcinol/alkylpyrone synthase